MEADDAAADTGWEGLWTRDEGDERRPGLDRAAIVEAAVRLADEHGLAAVTMARLAKDLGFTPMALYRHVPNKAALEMLMVDAGVGQPPALAGDAGAWRAQLDQLARGISAVFWRHPWLLDIPVSGPPATPNNLRWLEAGLASLESTPLSMSERIQVWLHVTFYVRGVEQAQAQLRRGEADLEQAATSIPTFATMIRSMVDLADFPQLSMAVDSGMFDEPGIAEGEQEAELEYGLALLLDGIAATIERYG